MSKPSVHGLLLTLTLLVSAAAYGNGCPVAAPGPAELRPTAGCVGSRCPHGTPVQLHLIPSVPPGLPSQYPPGYTIQSCDEIVWNYGDGTVETKTGTARTTHTWSAPGNYKVTANVTNSLGTSTYVTNLLVGPEVRIQWLTVTASETAGSVKIPFTRVGDTNFRVSAILRVYSDPHSAAPVVRAGDYPVVFEPGETAKSVTIPLFDNKLYDGSRLEIRLVEPAGGVIPEDGQLRILDDEPQPTLRADDVVIREGTGGTTRVTIDVRLSAPLGTDLNLWGSLQDGTAETGSDYSNDWVGTQIKSGELTGTISFDVVPDREPEGDEHLTLRLGPYAGSGWPTVAGPVRITILDDDAELTPRVYSGSVGEQLPMTLAPGQRFDAPMTVAVRTTSPTVLRVPETITIPAGAVSVPFSVTLIGEGDGLVLIKVGAIEFSSRITARQPRALVASPASLSLPPGGTRTFLLSLSPPHDVPVTVTLTADAQVVSVPQAITVPAGGATAIEARGVGRGETTIAATPVERDITGTAVDVDVVTMRRRAAR